MAPEGDNEEQNEEDWLFLDPFFLLQQIVTMASKKRLQNAILDLIDFIVTGDPEAEEVRVVSAEVILQLITEVLSFGHAHVSLAGQDKSSLISGEDKPAKKYSAEQIRNLVKGFQQELEIPEDQEDEDDPKPE